MQLRRAWLAHVREARTWPPHFRGRQGGAAAALARTRAGLRSAPAGSAWPPPRFPWSFFFPFSHHLVRFSSSRCGVCGYSSQRAGGNGADKECGVRPYGAKLERALIVLGMKLSAPVGLSIKAITSLSLCYLAALFVSACIMPRIARRGEKRSVRFLIYYVWHQGSDGQFRAA